MAHPPSVAAPGSRPAIAAVVLGFAHGVFVDGIMLHQALQWHHFLSLVPGEALRDIRAQILSEGIFHVALYVYGCSGAPTAALEELSSSLAISGVRRRSG
ncbi:DUF2243 domain-containing protein [Siccirubricoccus deserti]|uniref:DUF2243 domain-containing protein n=1 Tax=Siccirubricoccus deserti TaxID=2013562 RepID=UPI001E54A16A|nr:DUF2243 domain-containing protein [Siccirubricoccus deserti]